MAFTLNLTIRGLCALVPRTQIPLQPGANPLAISRMRVLVLEAQQGGHVGGHLICPHHPQLEVEQPQGAPQVVPLAGHSIALASVVQPPSGLGISLQRSFWDVAQLEQVSSTFQVDDNFFRNAPPPVLAASLPLLAGVVHGVVDPLSPVLTFPSTGYSGRFALEVMVEIPIAGTSGSFTLTPFVGSTGTASVVSFSPRQGQTTVNATLSNSCDRDEIVPPGTPPHSDFAAYYLLDPRYTERDKLEIPLEAPAAQAPGEVRGEAVDTDSCIPATTPFNVLA